MDPEEVRQALTGCLESLGRMGGTQSSSHTADIALAIPDQAARVFFITLDVLPTQPSQAIPLIRWKLKKSVPFDIDASTISYLAHRQADEWQVLAVVSPAATAALSATNTTTSNLPQIQEKASAQLAEQPKVVNEAIVTEAIQQQLLEPTKK